VPARQFEAVENWLKMKKTTGLFSFHPASGTLGLSLTELLSYFVGLVQNRRPISDEILFVPISFSEILRP
jgi:hypothetical protein